MSARTDADLIAAVRLSEVAQPQIERLARELRCEAAVLVAVGDEDLMTTASAYGGAAEMREPIGQRIRSFRRSGRRTCPGPVTT